MVQSLEVVVDSGLKLQSGILRLVKPISMKTARALLLHPHHYEALEREVGTDNNVWALVVVQLPSGTAYINSIGKSPDECKVGRAYAVISDNSHEVVEGWLPEISRIIGGLSVSASWSDGTRERYSARRA